MPSDEALLRRIERDAGLPGLVEALSDRLSATDLQSLLLAVYNRRASQVEPSDLLQRYVDNRFVRPAVVDVATLLRFDLHALGQLPPLYEPIELSPVAPVGTSSAVATVHQNKVVSTCRNTEVVADSTNVLALESAVRRRALLRGERTSPRRVRLCASHRLLRAQKFDMPGAFSHFRVLALTAAGRDEGHFRFELETLYEQLDYFLRVLETFNPTLRVRLSLTVLQQGGLEEALQTTIVEPLSARASVVFDPSRQAGRGYYRDACFKIHCLAPDTKTPVEIGDGGFTSWTQTLLNNRKERFLIGCLAGQRICTMPGRDPGPR